MKRNNLIENLTNFIVPIITLYSIFLIVKYVNEGLFAIFYAILLISTLVIIYFAARNQNYKIKSILYLPKIIWGILFISLTYILSVFLYLVL